MKKGFTLIELLAVIVVLAVIAIIAIPIITNVIDKAKQGALKDSAYGILDSAEMYLAKNINKGIDDTMEFTCNNGKCLSGTEEIDYKGKIESGKVRIYADSKIELCVTDNKSSALKTVANKKVEVATGTCDYGELNYGVTALVSKNALDAKQSELDEMTIKYNDLKALVDQSNITAEDIKEGKIAYSNGEIVTGVLENNTSFEYIGSEIGGQLYSVDLNIPNISGTEVIVIIEANIYVSYSFASVTFNNATVNSTLVETNKQIENTKHWIKIYRVNVTNVSTLSITCKTGSGQAFNTVAATVLKPVI